MAHGAVTKFLIYSQDGLGLGHLRRNVNICYQIKKRCPQASCLIIADSPVAPFFKLPSHCDFIKIPTLVKVDTGVWRAERLAVQQHELMAMRAELIRNVLSGFQPDVFLVDHMPHGALGELLEPLAELRRHSPQTKLILGIRDILGAPEVIRKQWETEGAFAAIAEYYDAVCIYGSSDLFDAAAEYQFPAVVRDRARYCGYVCRDEAQVNPEDKKPLPGNALSDNGVKRNGRLAEKFVLITGGGGADAAYMMDRFIDAVRRLKNEIPFQAFIATGPFVHKEQRKLLRQKSQGLPITVGRMEGDSIRYFRRADLVVSMAGYNTISEIMLFRKNALVVPRAGPSAEQTMRTRLMSQRGLFSTIAPQTLTGENMAEQLFSQLHAGQNIPEARLPDLNGAQRVAEFILQS